MESQPHTAASPAAPHSAAVTQAGQDTMPGQPYGALDVAPGVPICRRVRPAPREVHHQATFEDAALNRDTNDIAWIVGIVAFALLAVGIAAVVLP